MNDVSKHNPSIYGGFELEAAQLTGVNEIVFDDVELKSFGDHLFDEFANSVEENNRVEEFRTVVSWLV